MITVDVPGKGTVEFPDDTTQDKIEASLKDWAAPAPQSTALGTAASEFGLGLAPGAAAAAAFGPGMEGGAAIGSFAGPVGTAVGGLAGGLGAAGLAGLGAEWAQHKALQKIAPQFLEQTQKAEQEHPIAGAVGRIASGIPSFEFAPGQTIRGLASIPKVIRGVASEAEAKAAKSAAAQIGSQLGITAAQTGIEEHRVPTPSELLESAAFATVYGHPRFSLPIPSGLQKGLRETYAAQKGIKQEGGVEEHPRAQDQRISTEAGGGNRPEPAARLEKETQIPLEAPTDIPRFSGSDEQGWTLHFGGKSEGGFETRAEAEVAAHQVMAGDRVMPGPGAEETGAPMSREELQRRDKERSRQFTPEEEDVVAQAERTAIDEGKALNTPVEPVEDIKPGDADVPWGLNFLRATGTGAELHKANFRSWVGDLLDRGLSREQIGNAVRSRIGEEKFHNDVMARIDRPELESYWNSLTGLEKQIENYIYTGNRKGYDYVSEANRAHEAIRRRLQQAHGMTPSEFAETVGKEHVTVRTLDLLGRMIRNAREVFGTEASATQRALYDKATANIQYAKSVLSGQQPGAVRRGGEPEVAKEAPMGEGKRLNKYGHPMGTTYHATPEDWAEWQRVSSRPLMEPGIWPAREAIKNNYGGMPPEPPSGVPAAVRRKQETLDENEKRRWYQQRLEDPSLLDRAIVIDGDVMVPVGGKRVSGSSSYIFHPRNAAEQAAKQIKGRDGFPDVRIVEARDSSGKIESYAIEWGEKASGSHAEAGRKFGYREDVLFGQPAAARRGKKEPGQGDFFKDVPSRASGQPNFPRVEEGQRGSPESSFAPRLSALDLERNLAQNFASTRPSFKEFLDWAQRNMGHVKPEQLRSLWEDTTWNTLLNASGEKLAELRKSLDLEDKLGRGTVPDKEAVGRTVRGHNKLQRGPQEKRAVLISAIAQKLLGEAAPRTKNLERKSITLDDIDFQNARAAEGAYHIFNEQESRNIDSLSRVLGDRARASRHEPVSVTKRLAVLVNKKTGEVEIVDAYKHGRQGIEVYDPSGATGVRNKPHRPLKDVLGQYRVRSSILLDEPVQNFHQHFDTVRDFTEAIERDAAARESIAEHEVAGESMPQYAEEAPEGLRPEDIAQGELPPTQVSEGEGGSVIGPQAGEARAMMGVGRGEIERSRTLPMTASEASSVLDYLTDEVGKVESPEDMRLAVEGLVDKAQTKSLRGIHRQFISAIQKAARGIIRENAQANRGAKPEERVHITDDQAYEAALNHFYEAIHTSKGYEDYIQKAMGRFASQARPEIPPLHQPVVPGAPVSARGVARELTGPELTRKPLTRFPLPRSAQETEPSPAEMLSPEAQRALEEKSAVTSQGKGAFPVMPTTESQVGGSKFQKRVEAGTHIPKGVPKEMPHEARVRPGGAIRGVDETARKYWDELGVQAAKFAALPTRASTVHEINATMDGVDRIVDHYSNVKGQDIRLASADVESPTNPTAWRKFMGGPTETPEAKLVRRSAKAVVAALEQASDNEWRRVKIALDYIRKRKLDEDEASNNLKHAVESGDEQRISEATLRSDEARGKRERAEANFRPYRRPAWVKDEHFDNLDIQVDQGIAKASGMLKSPFLRTRWVGRRYLRAAQNLKAEVDYARKHFDDPEMRETVATYEKAMADHLKLMQQHGIDIAGRDYYVPGRYDGEIWADNIITWGDMRVLGKQYRMPKSFRNYYEAIADGPYIPVNGDVADLAQHSLRAGGRVIQRDFWLNSLKGVTDPVSKQPIAIEPAWAQRTVEMQNPDTGEMEQHKQPVWTVPKGKLDYRLVYTSRNSKPIAVREGYKAIVESCLAQSAIRTMPVARQALMASQMVKHGLILILDTFHPGRLLQYGAALSGKNWHGVNVGWRGGWSALTYTPEGLERAVRIGAIPKEAAEWANQPVKVYDRGRIVNTTRQKLIELALSKGLNASQSADTLYRNAIQRIPGIGKNWNELLSPINKWTFDKITPGLIAESFIHNFERMNPRNRHLSMDRMMREVIRDMNVYYGNMGRQGIFKNPTFRDLAQIFVLAPLWQEGLVGKELRTLSRVSGASWLAGRRGLGTETYLGPLTRGIARGLGIYFAATQAINLVSRGHFTWQNEEEDHKLDAWIPSWSGKEGEGIWLSPLSVFGEVTHDLIRLGQTKPTVWNAITQFGENKMGPLGRAERILREGKTPSGDIITSTPGVLKAAAKEFVPPPISLSTPLKSMLPGVFGKPRPGEGPQRLLSQVGIKTQLPATDEQTVRRLADRFKRKEGLQSEPMVFSPTDEASYAKLRAALRNDDLRSARNLLADLRKGHTDQQILHAMKESTTRPFTGSKVNEKMFLFSLDDHELDAYFRANLARSEAYQRFLDFYLTQ